VSNIVLDPGAGGATLGTDTVTGIDYQKVKIAVGADGTVPVSVSSTAPLPVTGTLAGITGNVTVVQGVGANLNVDVANFPGTQPISGTTTANQGTPNSTANSWPITITDATHGPAAVKAASTAAVATDLALVVAISPNNTVPISAAALPLPTGAMGATGGTVGLVAGVAAIGSVTVTGTPAISGTVTANQGTANTAANAWPAKITDGTNVGAVKAASTAAVAADPALVVAISPNNTVGVTGTLTGVTTVSTVSTVSTVAAVTAITNALPAGTNTIGKVDILGNAGAIMDAVITAATAPANGLATLVECVTTPPALTTGQSVMAQCDYQGNTFVQPYRRSNVKAATGTFTSATATALLAAQASGIFADLGSISITQGLGATANAYFSVNVSDGTNTYKFNMFSNFSVSTTPTGTQPISLVFYPPIPATTAATAWTVAVSSATDTPTVNVTATFYLQKAS
jgi:hypothetical protein